MKLKSVLFFDSMLTPKIITLVYWLLLVGCVGSGLLMILGVFGGGLIQGLLVALLGSAGARIWSELMIVMFKINENLQRVADASVHEKV